MEFWILILVLFFVKNSLDKADSVKVKLEETPHKTFDEIFGEGWRDKGKAEDLKTPPTNFGQNVHHQIDRQNIQLGQIEPNSTDQNPPLTEFDHSEQIEPNSSDQNPPLTKSDHSGQTEPKSTDQNPPLTESDHSGQIEPNSTDQNPTLTESDQSKNIAENERKQIVDKFHAMKDEFMQKGKFPYKERTRIENKIAKHLKVSRSKIYKWKKEFGLSHKKHNFVKKKNERKNLIEKFDQMKAELKRADFKNSYNHQIDKTVAKELGLSFMTIYNWKRELRQIRPNYSDDEKLEIVNMLMRMKSKHSGEDKKSCKKIDKEIAERFDVSIRTINQWKKEFGLNQKKPKNDRKNLIEKFLMKRFYEIKGKNPKITDEDIAKMLKIGRTTLIRWNKEFHPNSVDGHSVEENAAANVQEIRNSNSGSI